MQLRLRQVMDMWQLKLHPPTVGAVLEGKVEGLGGRAAEAEAAPICIAPLMLNLLVSFLGTLLFACLSPFLRSEHYAALVYCLPLIQSCHLMPQVTDLARCPIMRHNVCDAS